MTAEVRKLFTKTESGEEEVIQSIDAGIVLVVGEGRQMTFRTLVDRALPLERQKQIVRDMCSLADTEKASYELADAEAKLLIQEKALALAEADVRNIDERADARREQIKVEIETLQQAQRDRATKMEQQWRATGRQGQWKPRGAEQAELSGISKDIDKLAGEQRQIDEKREADRRARHMAIVTAKQEIGLCKEQILRHKKTLGMPNED